MLRPLTYAAATVAGLLALTSAPASAQLYTYASTFGTLGNGNQQFDGPVALSIDVSGHRLFVADETKEPAGFVWTGSGAG